MTSGQLAEYATLSAGACLALSRHKLPLVTCACLQYVLSISQLGSAGGVRLFICWCVSCTKRAQNCFKYYGYLLQGVPSISHFSIRLQVVLSISQLAAIRALKRLADVYVGDVYTSTSRTKYKSSLVDVYTPTSRTNY